MSRNVAIFIFDDVEVLDFCVPFEVFGVTRQAGDGEAPFHVYTVAEKAGPVLARNNLSVNPDWTIDNCPQPDILLIPGGSGTRKQMNNEKSIHWLQEQAGRVELLPQRAVQLTFLDCHERLSLSTFYGPIPGV